MNTSTNERQILIWRERESVSEKKIDKNRAGSVWDDHVHKVFSGFCLPPIDLARLFSCVAIEESILRSNNQLYSTISSGMTEKEVNEQLLAAMFDRPKTISRCWSDVLRVLAHKYTHTLSYRLASAGSPFSWRKDQRRKRKYGDYFAYERDQNAALRYPFIQAED